MFASSSGMVSDVNFLIMSLVPFHLCLEPIWCLAMTWSTKALHRAPTHPRHIHHCLEGSFQRRNLPLVLIFFKILTPVLFQHTQCLEPVQRLPPAARQRPHRNRTEPQQDGEGDNGPEAVEDLLLEHLYPLLAAGCHTKGEASFQECYF